MNVQLQQFRFNTQAIRVVLVAAAPWFVAADVAEALRYRDAGNMVRILDGEDRGTQIVSTPSGDQSMVVINESGLYSAILRSRKPEAKQFRRWVTTEVLPSIHRTGFYQLDVDPLEIDETAAGLKRARSAYNNWAFEARTLLKQAGVKPPEWPFDPDDNTALATAVVSNLLSSRRWLLSFDCDMRPQMTAVPPNSYVMTEDQLPQVIAEPGQIRLSVLPKIIEAAAQRLGESMNSRAPQRV